VRFSQKSKKLLTLVRGVGDRMVISPPNRFLVFGDGKNDGLVVEGRLADNTDEIVAIGNFRTIAKSYSTKGRKRVKVLYYDKHSKDQKNKSDFCRSNKYLDRLDTLYETRVVGSFHPRRDWMVEIRKTAKLLESTHIRFFNGSDEKPRVHLFNVRNNFDDVYDPTGEIGHAYQNDLPKFDGNVFSLSVKVPTFNLLPIADYGVTVFENGIIEFQSLEEKLTFLIRDQLTCSPCFSPF
jgi:hypothetical protein